MRGFLVEKMWFLGAHHHCKEHKNVIIHLIPNTDNFTVEPTGMEYLKIVSTVI